MCPSVSVIVPAYNAAHVLAKTVPSMMAQDRRAEWIFVDDGSTDETHRTLQSLLAPGPRAEGATARVVRLDVNRGRAGARNAGIREATGTTLVFMDADVAPAPRALDGLVAALEIPGAAAAVGRFVYADADASDPYHRYLASPHRGGGRAPDGSALDWKYFLLGLAALRAETLAEVGGFDPSISYGEDLELACRLAERFPQGLRRAEAVGHLHDLGDIDSALRKMREFARDNLPSIVERHPAAAEMVGLHRVGFASGVRGRVAQVALHPWLALWVRRALPVLPSAVSDGAVRYLLASTLYSEFRAGTLPLA